MKRIGLIVFLLGLMMAVFAEDYHDAGASLATIVNDTPAKALNGTVGIISISSPYSDAINLPRLWSNYDFFMNKARFTNLNRMAVQKKMQDKNLIFPISRSYQQYSQLAAELGMDGWYGVTLVNETPGPESNLALVGQLVRCKDNNVVIADFTFWSKRYYQETALDIAMKDARRRFRRNSENLRLNGYKEIMIAPATTSEGKQLEASYNLKIRSAMCRTRMNIIGIGDVDGEPFEVDPSRLAEEYGVDAIVYPTVTEQVSGDKPKTTHLDLSLKMVDVKTGNEVYTVKTDADAKFWTPTEYRRRTDEYIRNTSIIGGSLILLGVPVLLISSHIEREPDYYDINYQRWFKGEWKTDTPLVYLGAAMELGGFAALLSAGYLMLE